MVKKGWPQVPKLNYGPPRQCYLVVNSCFSCFFSIYVTYFRQLYLNLFRLMLHRSRQLCYLLVSPIRSVLSTVVSFTVLAKRLLVLKSCIIYKSCLGLQMCHQLFFPGLAQCHNL